MMGYIYETPMTVAFHDLDPLRMVWHGNYLKYFDVARFGLFNEAGVDLYDYMMNRKIALPIIRSAVKHIAPLCHGDEFVCRAEVVDVRYKLTMAFSIRRTTDNVICARGTSDQVAVRMPEMKMEFEIPEDIIRALGF